MKNKGLPVPAWNLSSSLEDNIHNCSPEKMRFFIQNSKDDEVETKTENIKFYVKTIGPKYIIHKKRYLKIIINEFTRCCEKHQWYSVDAVTTKTKNSFGVNIVALPVGKVT